METRAKKEEGSSGERKGRRDTHEKKITLIMRAGDRVTREGSRRVSKERYGGRWDETWIWGKKEGDG